MKIKNVTVVILATTLLLGLHLESSLADPPLGTKTKTIKLKVDDDDGSHPELIIKTGGSDRGCNRADSPAKGCIKIEYKYAADLVFKMTGSPKCTTDNEWVFSGFQLAGYGSATKPAEAAWGQALTHTDVISDFNANAADGSVPFTDLGDGEIRVHDKNEYSFDIWYRLKASCDGKDVYSDPRIKNTGK